MANAMTLCEVCRPQSAEDGSPGCQDPVRDELSEGLGDRLSHRSGKTIITSTVRQPESQELACESNWTAILL